MAKVSSKKLCGMSAFAILGCLRTEAVLCRDRLGIKPLYFDEAGSQMSSASEIKDASGVRPRAAVPRSGRPACVPSARPHPPPWTAIRGVSPLAPGHIGVWQGEKWHTQRYWSPDPHSSSPAPAGKIAADLSDVLLDAMRNHLVSDVPVLIFLSGGTDSACLAALARAAGAENLSAMTVGFAEAEFDESGITRRTADALGVPLQTVTLYARRVEADLDHAIWALDQPSVDGLNSYWISKLGAEAGFKVALSGQGGDELFGGYESLKWFERFHTVARWPGRCPPCRLAACSTSERFRFAGANFPT